MNCSAKISLIDGNVDPSHVTRVLGIEPTYSWIVGDLRKSKKSAYSDNGWEYAWKFESHEFPVEVFSRINHLFVTNRDSVFKIFKDYGGYLQLTFPPESGGVYLETDYIANLNDLGLGLEIIIS